MKKDTWKMVIQIAISILTAIATSLGVSSCTEAAGKNILSTTTAPPIYNRWSGLLIPRGCH